MPQFDATIKHIKEGLRGFTVSAAIKNIEGWEATLEKVETTGVKTIVKDLENLKKHLQAETIDSEQIRKLVVKLGHETVTLASREDGEKSKKIKALGEALTHAAETAKAA
jgi:3-deoxy-D-manno-octulosonic-acid transferase